MLCDISAGAAEEIAVFDVLSAPFDAMFPQPEKAKRIAREAISSLKYFFMGWLLFLFFSPCSNIAQKVKISKKNTDIIFEMEIRARAVGSCYGMEAGDLRG